MSLADFLTIFVNILDISRNSKNINIFKLGSLCAPQNFNEFQKSNWIIHKNSWYPIILNIFFLLAFLIIPKLCIVTKVVFVKQKKTMTWIREMYKKEKPCIVMKKERFKY